MGKKSIRFSEQTGGRGMDILMGFIPNKTMLEIFFIIILMEYKCIFRVFNFISKAVFC